MFFYLVNNKYSYPVNIISNNVKYSEYVRYLYWICWVISALYTNYNILYCFCIGYNIIWSFNVQLYYTFLSYKTQILLLFDTSSGNFHSYCAVILLEVILYYIILCTVFTTHNLKRMYIICVSFSLFFKRSICYCLILINKHIVTFYRNMYFVIMFMGTNTSLCSWNHLGTIMYRETVHLTSSMIGN